MALLRIRDWDKHFENSSSRKLKRLEWVAIPNKTDGEGYTALVDHPNAAAHLGAWYAIIEAASKQNPRGTLPGGIPQDISGICRSLGRMSRLPAAVFDEVIPRLLDIGWLESAESADVVAESADVVAESADASGGSAAIVAAHRRELHNTTSSVRKPSSVVKHQEQSANDQQSPPQFVQFPRTAHEICSRFPAADVVLVGQIVEASAKAYLSVSCPKIPEPNDETYAAAVVVATTAKQTSAALYLTTVPTVLGNWAKCGRNGNGNGNGHKRITRTYTPPVPPTKEQELEALRGLLADPAESKHHELYRQQIAKLENSR